MITQQVSIFGWRFSLDNIRKNLLACHTKYMGITIEEEFAYMGLNAVQQNFKNLWEFSDNIEILEELLIKLKNGT